MTEAFEGDKLGSITIYTFSMTHTPFLSRLSPPLSRHSQFLEVGVTRLVPEVLLEG